MELLAKLMEYLPAVMQLLGGLTLVATLVVQLTPSLKDDELVGEIKKWLLKAMHWMPTLGVNPKTKELEDALAAYPKKKK